MFESKTCTIESRSVSNQGQRSRSLCYQGHRSRSIGYQSHRSRSVDYQGQRSRSIGYQSHRSRSDGYHGQNVIKVRDKVSWLFMQTYKQLNKHYNFFNKKMKFQLLLKC